MNGARAREEETPEGRVAAFIRQWIYAQWPRDSHLYPPDYADIERVLFYRIRRELILERICEAGLCGQPLRKREHVRALLELDAANGQHTPYSDCT